MVSESDQMWLRQCHSQVPAGATVTSRFSWARICFQTHSVTAGGIRLLVDCWTKSLSSFLTVLFLNTWSVLSCVSQHGGWLQQSYQVRENKREPVGGSHSLLSPNLRSDTPSLVLYSFGWKQVPRSSPHSRGGVSTKVGIPGGRDHWEPF